MLGFPPPNTAIAACFFPPLTSLLTLHVTQERDSFTSTRREELLNTLHPHYQNLIDAMDFHVCAFVARGCVDHRVGVIEFLLACGWVSAWRVAPATHKHEIMPSFPMLVAGSRQGGRGCHERIANATPAGACHPYH